MPEPCDGEPIEQTDPPNPDPTRLAQLHACRDVAFQQYLADCDECDGDESCKEGAWNSYIDALNACVDEYVRCVGNTESAIQWADALKASNNALKR